VKERQGRAARSRPVSTPGIARLPLGALAGVAAVFAIKLAVWAQLSDHPLLQPDPGRDAGLFVQLAGQVGSGNVWLGPGLFAVPPLYVYFLAGVLKAAGGVADAARLAQIALGSVGVLLIFDTARLWYGRRAAWIAAALATLTGAFTLHEILLLSYALDPFLAALALWCAARALRAGSPRWWVATGVALGLFGLNRPQALVAAAGITVLLLVVRRWRQSVFAAAGMALALAPFLLRNVIVDRDVSPVSSHGGVEFYIGNNSRADGTFRMVDGLSPFAGPRREESRQAVQRAIGRQPTDSDVSAYFYGQGWSWTLANPADAARLFGRKVTYALNAAELPLNYSVAHYLRDEPTLLRVLRAGPWLLLPLGLAGLLFAAPSEPERRSAFYIWASFGPFYVIGLAAFFVAEPLRLPLLVGLSVLAGGTIEWAIVKWRAVRLAPDTTGEVGLSVRDEGPTGSPKSFARLLKPGTAIIGAFVVVLAVLAAYTNWPFRLDDGRAEERTRMALVLIDREQFGQAEALASAIATAHPAPATLHLRLGRALLIKAQPEASVRHLEQALKLAPERPEIQYAYGQALVEANRPKEAVPHLRQAHDAGVRVEMAGYDLARALAMIGDRPGARRVLQNVRPGRPDDAAAWFALGQLAMDVEAPRLAEAFARRALSARPDHPASHQQLGLALAGQGRFDEARRALEEALRLHPTDPAAQLNYAVALAELGRVQEARTHALEALKLRPDYDRARKFLAALPK
jgi:tetratricopeptide (TPR) repeat protein